MTDRQGRRGQTEGVAVVLLTAVVLVAVGTFGAFYLGTVTDRTATVAADVAVTAVDDGGTTTLTVTHAGGEPLDDGAVLLQDRGATYALPEPFAEGERWTTSLAGAPAGSDLSVLVVENETETVVFRSRVTVSG
jgi:hypothetical protein